MNSLFFDALVATGPHRELGRHADTYGRLIGSWFGEIQHHDTDGSVSMGGAEVHFAWALQGRAVQDVWISPSPRHLDDQLGKVQRRRYGTTLRIFDPTNESWRVVWINSATGMRADLIGWRQGDDVIQLGVRDGLPIRWTFSEILANSFRWQGHVLARDGTTWRVETEYRFHK